MYTRNVVLTAFARLQDGHDQILLLRRQNTGHADGCYGMPGGRVEPGEDFVSAVIREVLEEVGCVVRPEDCRLYALHQMFDGDIEYVNAQFLIRVWQGEPRICEEHKADAIGWFALDALPEKLGDITRAVLSPEVISRGWYVSR